MTETEGPGEAGSRDPDEERLPGEEGDFDPESDFFPIVEMPEWVSPVIGALLVILGALAVWIAMR